MNRRGLVAVIAASCLMLAACQDGNPPRPVVTTSAPSPALRRAPSPSPSELPTSLPTPTALSGDAQKFLLMLEDVAPLLTNDDLFAIELGEGVCSRTEFGWSDADIRAWIQHTTGEHSFEDEPVLLNDDKANSVLAAARGYLC